MNRIKLNAALILFALFALMACDSDDPEPVNEEELITSVRLTFTGTGNTDEVIIATFKDFDGAGGNSPIVTNPNLSANSTYAVSVEFLNETENPVEDITEEVEDEDEDHQVFYEVGAGLNFTYTYDDEDGNGDPIGLSGNVTTGDASTGSLSVILVHEPNKSASGVSSGDLTNAGGEEDVRVEFTVSIQ